jgi:site-specific DNA-methyltransferase (adenine-specific)
MEYMATLPDNAFDLAIVDPPYGITNKTKRGAQRSPHLYKIRSEEWDVQPSMEYFEELKRVSANWIVWGANYFEGLFPLTGFIFWDKHQPIKNYARGELAAHSFDMAAKLVSLPYYGVQTQGDYRFHPTQKPIKLYEWLLDNYAKEGDRILDTHLGSGSSAIAAHYGGFDFVGCELDSDYYNAAQARFHAETAQRAMF